MQTRTMLPATSMRRRPVDLARYLQNAVADADDFIDAARRRFDARFSRNRPQHIAAYRGYADATGAQLSGRILADAPLGGPKEDDDWWDNLWNTYRRFESDEVPYVGLRASFRDASAETTSDGEGYYQLHLPTRTAPSDLLWDNATLHLADGTLATLQPVLQISPAAAFGVISDIDDTVLESSITNWKLAAQLVFLHNARTRKPLQGLAALYQALQRGVRGENRNPIFYVSSSPWNLYDLLDDFMELNAIPPGPMFLRDLGLDSGKLVQSRGHRHKLERVRELVHRLPQLRWLLIGDSGQADAELYAEAAQEFGERILAIYIRDVDLELETARDRYVDGFIDRVAGTRVPMLRVADSSAIAAHALGLGLIAEAALSGIAGEVRRDEARPTLDEATAPLAAATPDAPPPAGEAGPGTKE
jgi:phosphatidate phosphatase APP1